MYKDRYLLKLLAFCRRLMPGRKFYSAFCHGQHGDMQLCLIAPDGSVYIKIAGISRFRREALYGYLKGSYHLAPVGKYRPLAHRLADILHWLEGPTYGKSDKYTGPAESTYISPMLIRVLEKARKYNVHGIRIFNTGYTAYGANGKNTKYSIGPCIDFSVVGLFVTIYIESNSFSSCVKVGDYGRSRKSLF